MRIPAVAAALAALTLAGPALAAADTTAPALTGLTRIGGASINVATLPARGTVRVEFTEAGTGLRYATVQWRHVNSGLTVHVSEFSERPRRTGSIDVATPMLSLHHPRGAWTIDFVQLCDRASNCSYAYLAQLDVLQPDRGFHLVNDVAPDAGAPTLTEGTRIMAEVSLATVPRFRYHFRANDNVSGVRAVYVCLLSPSGNQSNCATGSYSRPLLGTFEYAEGQFYEGGGWETGTWKVYQVVVYDQVGHSRVYSTLAQFNALFPGGHDLQVDP